MGLKMTELALLGCPILVLLVGTFYAGFATGKLQGFKQGLAQREPPDELQKK